MEKTLVQALRDSGLLLGSAATIAVEYKKLDAADKAWFAERFFVEYDWRIIGLNAQQAA